MKKTVSYFRLAFAVCASLAAILQILAVVISYDVGTNYFRQGAVLPILSVVFALLGAVCGTVAARMTDIETQNTTPFPKGISPAPASVGFLVTAVFLFVHGGTPLSLVTAALMLVSAGYGILTGIPKFQKSTIPVYLGIAAIVGYILLNAYYYFDITVEMNSPIKVMTQIGLLCAMVSLTSELRYLLGKPMPRMFLTVSAWVVSIGALSALSVPLAFFLGKTDRADYAAGGFLVFCAVLTSIVRIKTLLRTPAPEAPSEADNTADSDDTAE